MVFCVSISEKAVKRQLREVNNLLTMPHSDQEQEIELQHAWFRVFGMARLVEESIAELAVEEMNDLTKFTDYVRIDLLLISALRKIETQMDQLLSKGKHEDSWMITNKTNE